MNDFDEIHVATAKKRDVYEFHVAARQSLTHRAMMGKPVRRLHAVGNHMIRTHQSHIPTN